MLHGHRNKRRIASEEFNFLFCWDPISELLRPHSSLSSFLSYLSFLTIPDERERMVNGSLCRFLCHMEAEGEERNINIERLDISDR